jgi:hypothetical protein
MSELTSACRPLGSQPRTRLRKALSRPSLGEEVYLHQYHTFEQAHVCLQTFLEDVYNAKRLHSSLDYVPTDRV